MPDGLILRAPEERDIDQLTEVMNQPAVRWGTGRLPYTPRDWVENRVRKTDVNTQSVVAEVEGQAIGWATLVQGQGRIRHTGNVSVTVHDAHQGKGYGRALFDALIDLADNWLGLIRLELHVYTDNAAAVALYRSYGFEIEGTCRAAVLRGGRLVDTYVMGRVRAAPVPETETGTPSGASV